MSKVTMVGCDLHDRTMVICWAVDRGKPQQKSFSNDSLGRMLMIPWLKEVAAEQKSERIVFAYEASGQGYGLSDFLFDHDIECYVLSPTHLPRTPKSAKQKTDSKDAEMLLEQVRGFVLAGNKLPTVWTPPLRLRNDRELVRARVDLSDDSTRIMAQIKTQLKRMEIRNPSWYTTWTKRYLQWLRETVETLDEVVAPVLGSMLDRYELCRTQKAKLDRDVLNLSKTDRYRKACEELRKLPGVGLLSAMTFLTEMGDLERFHNRREVAAYLGLCPASFESGESSDRKGRITRQGPARLRKILCQAAWVSLSRCEETGIAYNRIKAGKGNRTKKAIVAIMRRLAIKMWHRALACGVPDELHGRGGPHDLNRTPKPSDIAA